MTPRTLAKILLPLLVLGVSVGIFRYMGASKPKAKAMEARETVSTVATQTVTKGPHVPQVLLYGRVESPRAASLSAALAAEVTAVPALEGQRVDQGDLLVQLDDQDARLAVDQRRAEITEIQGQIDLEQNQHRHHRAALPQERKLLQLSQRAVERAQRLKQQRAASESSLDEAEQSVARQKLVIQSRELELKSHPARLAQLQAKLDRATAALRLAEVNLARARITAPFAGIVSEVHAAPGDRARIGDPLVAMYDHQALEVRAQIPKRLAREVERGLAEGLFAEWENGALRMPLSRLSGQVDAKTGGIDGLFRVPAMEPVPLRLRQFVTLQLSLPVHENSVAIPAEALYDQRKIYILKDQRMQGVAVQKIGDFRLPDGRTGVLIESPKLVQGATLITTRLPNAMDGLRVSPHGESTGPNGNT